MGGFYIGTHVKELRENGMAYTTVRFAPLKDAQVRRTRVNPVMGFSHFQTLFQNGCKKSRKRNCIHYGEICAAQGRSGGEG